MHEISTILHSPSFWVCTGVGSVVFNFIGHYLIRLFEFFATYVGLNSTRYMRRRRRKFLKRVALLNCFVREHPFGVQICLHRSNSMKIVAVGCVVFAGICMNLDLLVKVSNPGKFFADFGTGLGDIYLIFATGFASASFRLERIFRRSKYFYAVAPRFIRPP